MEGKLIKFKCDTKNGGAVYVFAPNKVTASFKCALQFGSCLSAVEVAEKPFDITQHEFSDERLSFSDDTLDIDIGCCAYYDDSVTEVVNYDFNKSDAIAIAKHFKLTAEDLK